MTLSQADYFTKQFYSWEYRGRGWFMADEPVQLEPPFIPFFRHRYTEQIDDGRRHTLLSKLREKLNAKKSPAVTRESLDYETIEPYFSEETELVALQIKLVKDKRAGVEKIKALLVMLSTINTQLSFEIIGAGTEIIFQFVCEVRHRALIETYVHAYIPEFALVCSDEYMELFDERYATYLVDFGLKEEFMRPLANGKHGSLDPLSGFFAILERLGDTNRACLQILFQQVENKWNESIIRSVTMHDNTSFFADDASMPALALAKVQSPLFGVAIRTFAQAEDLEAAGALLEALSSAIVSASRSNTNELLPLSNESYDFYTRAGDMLTRRSHRLGMLLNLEELVTFLHFPSENVVSKKLYGLSRKTKEVPAIAKNKAFQFGNNGHNGIQTPVTVGIEERLKHTHILGATGTGKSTLLANLILQDIQHGIGVVLFDPHGDLVDDIIARIPENKVQDIVLIDPADIEYPIGLNILQAYSDIEKEVLSSDLVAAFKKYATSWGDQMSSVLGNAIQAILEHPTGGTLNDLRRLLIDKDFRLTYLKGIQDPTILYYWYHEYPLLKTNSVGPILTRLDTFLRPKSIRNMVVQKKGIDFEALFNSNKIILLKLSQGLIGKENSYLLGSLILSKIHQIIFRRQQGEKRNIVMLYLDEFQNFITPSIKEMLSGIRKYNVGLTLSHQDLQQLQREDTELLNSVLSNISTRIVFRVGEPDAKRLQDGFSSFDATDLQNLGRGEAIIRIEQPQYDCSLDTVPLQLISGEEGDVALERVMGYCRNQYASSKNEVERCLFESLNFAKPAPDDAPKPKKPDVQTKKEYAEFFDLPQRPKESIEPEIPDAPKDLSTHRYLQTLVKRMAEDRGYVASIEMQIPNNSGAVDVLLTKEGKTIAVEICNTTDAEWEMHNIAKCIIAGYESIVSLSGDLKQLEKIKVKCVAEIPNFNEKNVHFFTPDALFSFLDVIPPKNVPQEKVMKGYRVNVTYDAISKEEMERKRSSITDIVINSMKRSRKK